VALVSALARLNDQPNADVFRAIVRRYGLLSPASDRPCAAVKRPGPGEGPRRLTITF
jgi:hypothetical protein